MISVVIIGYGNVGAHLHKAFLKTSNIDVIQVYARNLSNISHLDKAKITDNFNALKKADVFLIAVTDDAIPSVSMEIKNDNAFVVHTSGSVHINALKNNDQKGVFYPLQSFSKGKVINFDEVPFCLEATAPKFLEVLQTMASSIGKKVYQINSKQRQQLHVAAVFVNNFTNHMYKIGHDICEKHQIPFEILYPLIDETADKIKSLAPEDAQTGPAKRNDLTTIENHMSLLNIAQQKIYKTLTKSILNGQKL